MDRVALVTGGAQGIGEAIASHLAARGWRVAVADLRAGAGHFFVRCDVSRESAVKRAIARVIKRFGRLDALVNNAGIADPHAGPLEKLALARWNRWLGVNLSGPFLMAKHAAPHLRRARGTIVNIASTRALMSEPRTEPYAAAKAGLVGLTHALAMTLGPQVRVNCVSPGWIAHKGKPTRKDHAQHPAGRVGRVEDIAEIVEFLVSGRSGFVTGQNFVVDGGMTKKMIYV